MHAKPWLASRTMRFNFAGLLVFMPDIAMKLLAMAQDNMTSIEAMAAGYLPAWAVILIAPVVKAANIYYRAGTDEPVQPLGFIGAQEKPNWFKRKFFPRLMEHEGGYVNHPRDPGGETMYGVTKRVARRFGYRGPMRKIPKSTARNIAKQLYWDKCRCDDLAPAVAWQVLDMAFNHGPARAVKILQQAVGATSDGKFGPATLALVKSTDVNDTLMRLNGYRLYFYCSLRTWRTFGRGWARRVAANLIYGAKDN